MSSSKKNDAKTPDDDSKAVHSKGRTSPPKDDVNDHLPPIILVFTVMACSGFLFMYAFRDVFSTGRTIGGAWDDAYLVRIVGPWSLSSW